ncbi:hypothetical protein [Actinomadura rugatobispora]|uniref:Uncharacterized protein n=1 Tax=Actinomadura rugatobispora TaxID=1994 RepID=A0ABW1A5G6_9ACTN|nr:hypothetical protein GCM10010200_017510 [Actinomadura rugatobispora]
MRNRRPYGRAFGDLIDTLPVQGAQFGQKLSAASDFKGRGPVGGDGLAASPTRPCRCPRCCSSSATTCWCGAASSPLDATATSVREPATSPRPSWYGWFIGTQTWHPDQADIARRLVEGRDPWLTMPLHPGPSGRKVQKAWNQWDFVPVAQPLAELGDQKGGVE